MFTSADDILTAPQRAEPGAAVKAYGAHAADKALEPLDIVRREPGAHGVQIEIAFCGVCHSVQRRALR